MCGTCFNMQVMPGCRSRFNCRAASICGRANQALSPGLASCRSDGSAVWELMEWSGVIWRYGMVCYAMAWYAMAWYAMAWYVMAWYAMLWHRMAWHDMEKELASAAASAIERPPPLTDGMLWSGMIRYGTAQYGMAWRGMAQYSTVQYGGETYLCRRLCHLRALLL